MKTRIVEDALGRIEIPEEMYYGAQTERARQNFEISGETTDQYTDYISAIALIKKAAAEAHKELGVLDGAIADAISAAADEVIAGRLAGQFPLNVLQGGGGTSSNMNLNEVIACRANEYLTGRKGFDRVHPNDHVNMGQSTNDVIPAAVKLSAWAGLERLRKETLLFAAVLGEKQEEFKNVVKLGRTCLQDAVPVTVGQEFSGYRSLVLRCAEDISAAQKGCLALPLGATAIGTGSGTYPGYRELVVKKLSLLTGQTVVTEENFFDGLQNGDIYLDVMHAVKKLAVGVSKIATDFRILCSGPRAGLNELVLPAVQPGSSIMPGKINPVMPELMNQICYDICGNDAAVTMAVEGGELDLNVWEPLAVKKIGSSLQILTNGLRLFRERCVSGVQVNEAVCRRYAERSLATCSLVSALFDYKTGTRVSHQAYDEDKTIEEVVVELGLMSKEDAAVFLDPLTLTDAEAMAANLERFKENGRKD